MYLCIYVYMYICIYVLYSTGIWLILCIPSPVQPLPQRNHRIDPQKILDSYDLSMFRRLTNHNHNRSFTPSGIREPKIHLWPTQVLYDQFVNLICRFIMIHWRGTYHVMNLDSLHIYIYICTCMCVYIYIYIRKFKYPMIP